MRWSIAIALPIAGLFILPSLAMAVDGPVVALHATMSHPERDFCGWYRPTIDSPACTEFVTDSIPTNADVMILLWVARADSTAGVGGISCGLSYDQSKLLMGGWWLCGDAETPTNGWPGNGGGNVITWDLGTNCQRTNVGNEGVHALVGAFVVYAYDATSFAVVPNASAGNAAVQVGNCEGLYSAAESVGGVVGFDQKGFNPCADSSVPSHTTTWSRLKAQYRD